MPEPKAVNARLRLGTRIAILVLLVVSPLALGAVHAPAYVPLLAVAHFVGLISWARGHWERAHGRPAAVVPARAPLVWLHGIVLLQLVPLPPALLRLLSPGSFAFYNDPLLLPLAQWQPVSVSPADTFRGLLFLSGMSLLYGAVYREFRDIRWQRRLAGAAVFAGFALTFVALLQAALAGTWIYGVWRPRWDWAVYGPYVNRNHFAGYLAMAAPLGLAFASEAFQSLRQAWRRRRRGWLALGQAEGGRLVLRGTETMFLLVGLFSSRSRGGVGAFLAATALFPLVQRQRRQAALLLLLVVLPAAAWVEWGEIVHGFESRGVRQSRVVMWQDFARLIPHFPFLGCGFNAFGAAYPRYQTVSRGVWWGEAHNEYLQIVLDLGGAGALPAVLVLVRLFLGAARGAQGTLRGGVFVGLVACGLHNLVDFNWQIPANAALFASLSGLALTPAERAPEG